MDKHRFTWKVKKWIFLRNAVINGKRVPMESCMRIELDSIRAKLNRLNNG